MVISAGVSVWTGCSLTFACVFAEEMQNDAPVPATKRLAGYSAGVLAYFRHDAGSVENPDGTADSDRL